MSIRNACLAGALLLGAAQASAQNTVLTRIGSGARAAGMANAFVALSDDGTAASWNPAGLGQLRKPEFSLVASSLGASQSMEGFRSPDDRFVYTPHDYGYSTGSPEFAAVAVPFDVLKKPFTLQLGWRRLYQLTAQGDAETTREPARPGVPESPALFRRHQGLSGNVDLVSLAASVRLTRRMLVGGSADLVRSNWEVDVAQVETPGRAAASDFLSIGQSHRLEGHSFTVGTLLTYPSLNVGLVYHFPFWMDYDISQSVESNLQPPTRQVSEPGTRMRFPRSIAGGVAWRPSSDWTLAADVTHDQWTRTTVDKLPGVPVTTNFFDNLPEDRTSTRDTLTVAVGAERLFRSEGKLIPLRFGAAYEPQGGMDPVTRDPVNVVMLATGVGFNTNSVKLDAAVQLRWAHYRIVETLGVANALEGVWDSTGTTYQTEWRLKLSFIYRIVETDKLRSLVKRVFVGP